jgi:hypothetical protein
MLQDFPLYSYIPAKDVARARHFYERKQDSEGNVMASVEDEDV